ncbi:helix-turn-helix transcriptional regulator [Prauserella halophila]|uniref:Helix-turn-helix transcriptional regulator n=1 Tax=Prauserella halophila TaxID=185641 RepID=A0ABP4H6A1_9PSEU
MPLSEAERLRGERLGLALRSARGARSMVGVAADAGISVETLRKIETGRIPTPAFFTVLAIADSVDLPLDDLRTALAAPPGETADSALSRRADAG